MATIRFEAPERGYSELFLGRLDSAEFGHDTILYRVYLGRAPLGRHGFGSFLYTDCHAAAAGCARYHPVLLEGDQLRVAKPWQPTVSWFSVKWRVASSR